MSKIDTVRQHDPGQVHEREISLGYGATPVITAPAYEWPTRTTLRRSPVSNRDTTSYMSREVRVGFPRLRALGQASQ
jgi:hypothetical protein